MPTSTAAGGMGDIECEENGKGILVEVTMATGRVQTMMEVWPIDRHLEEFGKRYNNAEAKFVAPSIFADSLKQIDYVKYKYNRTITPYSISSFLDFLEKNMQLYECVSESE